MRGPRVRVAPGAPYRGDKMNKIPTSCTVCPHESTCNTAMGFNDCHFYYARKEKKTFLVKLKQFFGKVFK